MKGKKALLADILFNSNLVNLFKRLPMRNKLIILNYHRIRPSDPLFSTPFDEGTYTLDADEFATQVEWLRNNTLLMSEKDLLDSNKDGLFSPPSASKPCVMLTFDDGYRDFYTLAYPILKHFNVPAALFVASQMINTRQISWWDIIAYLIKGCAKPAIHFDDRVFPMGNQKQDAIDFFLLQMKRERYEHTKYLLKDLSEACEVGFPDPELQNEELLTWEEIREMACHNITIGSHTHTHRVLSTLNPSAQKEEMILSKMIIEEKIGRPVHSIAYPVGEPHYITAETPEIAAACGYLLGYTTNSGVNVWNSIHRYAVRRMACFLEKVSTVSLLTVFPELFTWDAVASRQMKMMEAHPTYADAYYSLGIIYLGQGKINQAIKNFSEAVQANHNYTEAWVKLAISQAYAGRLKEAEQNLLSILEKKPLFADICYYLGIVYTGKGEISNAVEYLEKAVMINPTYKDALLKLGVLYCHQERFDLGLGMLERASGLDPSDQDLLALVEAGKQIIATHGKPRSELLSLFSSYIGDSDQVGELIGGFVTQLHISPNLNDIMTIIEKGSFPGEGLENLLSLFLDYRAMFPEYSDIHYMLGFLHRKLDHVGDAESCFSEAIRLNPNYVKARLNLFSLLKSQGRFREALEQGIVLERLSLPYPDLYSGLAEVYLGIGRLEDAAQFAQKSFSLNPTYESVRQLLQTIKDQCDKDQCDTANSGVLFSAN